MLIHYDVGKDPIFMKSFKFINLILALCLIVTLTVRVSGIIIPEKTKGDGTDKLKKVSTEQITFAGIPMEISSSEETITEKTTKAKTSKKKKEETTTSNVDLTKYLQAAARDSKYYVTWKQCSPAWGNETINDSENTMTNSGCSITSQSILIKMSGYAKTDDFTPLTYLRWAEENGEHFSNCALSTGAVSSYTEGNLYLAKSVRDKKYNDEKKLYKLAKWGYDNGYYMIMHISRVKGAGHYMPIIAFDTEAEKVYVNEIGRNTLTGLLDFTGYFGDDNPDTIMDGIDFYKCKTSTFKQFCEKGDDYIQKEVRRLRANYFKEEETKKSKKKATIKEEKNTSKKAKKNSPKTNDSKKQSTQTETTKTNTESNSNNRPNVKEPEETTKKIVVETTAEKENVTTSEAVGE